MTYCIVSGDSAKKSLLLLKKKFEDSDFLEEYTRYKIIDTNTYTKAEALAIYNVIKHIPIKIRNKCLGCLIMEDNQYFFFTPTRTVNNA